MPLPSSQYVHRAREALLDAMDVAIECEDSAAERALRRALYELPPVQCAVSTCRRLPAIGSRVCEAHLRPEAIPFEAMH